MSLKSYAGGTFRKKYRIGATPSKGVNLRKVMAGRLRKLRNTPVGDIGGGMKNRGRAEKVSRMIGYDQNKIEKANASRLRKSR